jgi:hypothetical protein
VRSKPFKYAMLVLFLGVLPVLAVVFVVLPAQRRKKKSTVRPVTADDPRRKNR